MWSVLTTHRRREAGRDGGRATSTGGRLTEDRQKAKTHKMVRDNEWTDMGQADGWWRERNAVRKERDLEG